jgi:hypothetical protein
LRPPPEAPTIALLANKHILTQNKKKKIKHSNYLIFLLSCQQLENLSITCVVSPFLISLLGWQKTFHLFSLLVLSKQRSAAHRSRGGSLSL